MSLLPSPPPDASATKRGLINLAAQSFAGLKTFQGGIAGTQLQFSGASAAHQLVSGLGAGASDVIAKIGSSVAYASQSATAALLSVVSGVGGTEKEMLRVQKGYAFNAGVVIDNQGLTNSGNILLKGLGAGDNGIFFGTGGPSAGGMALGVWTYGLGQNSTNYTHHHIVNSNAYSSAAPAAFNFVSSGGTLESKAQARWTAGATHTANLVEWYVGAVQKAAISAAGVLTLAGGWSAGGSCTTNGNNVTIGGGGSLACGTGGVGVAASSFALNLGAGWGLSDVAGTRAIVLDSVTALTAAGAGIASFKNAGVEKAKVLLDGEFECLTNNRGIVLRSADGTRYRITVPNGGAALTIAAA